MLILDLSDPVKKETSLKSKTKNDKLPIIYNRYQIPSLKELFNSKTVKIKSFKSCFSSIEIFY